MGSGGQMEICGQSSALKTIWRLRNQEGKVKRGIWRRNIVCDTGMVRDVWEQQDAAELRTCVWCCSYCRDFMVVIRARLSWSFRMRGWAFFRQNGWDQGEEDAQKWIHMKPQKVEAKHRLQASTSEDTGLFFLTVVCSASGHHTSLKLECVSYGPCLS